MPLFKASCLACHKLNGEGVELGPDLTQLDPKLSPLEMLKEIVEPSHKINEEYQTQVFELFDGRIVSGIVVEENEDEVKVVEKPLESAEPTILLVDDIEDRAMSKTSTMPEGLLDKLTREEILDLLAYVLAEGKENHKYFNGSSGGHHH